MAAVIGLELERVEAACARAAESSRSVSAWQTTIAPARCGLGG